MREALQRTATALSRTEPGTAWRLVVLRIVLGGEAGITIGWFAVSPASGTAPAGGTSSLPFGLAFLAGFSIDALFSLLDKLQAAMSDSSSAGGKATASRDGAIARQRSAFEAASAAFYRRVTSRATRKDNPRSEAGSP